MRRTTVYLDEKTILALRRLSRQEDRPQAELIREAVAAYVSKADKRPDFSKLPGLGEFRSGHSDTSSRAEEILREAARRKR